MSDEIEIENENESHYSSFWPLLILAVACICWFGYQAVQAYQQKSSLNTAITNAIPTINQAQDMRGRLYSFAQDLIQLSSKDSNAAQLVKEAHIQVQKTDDSSAPAKAP